MELNHLCKIAIAAAKKAGRYIREQVKNDISFERKSNADSLAASVVTEIDRAAEDIILSYIIPTLKEYDLGLLTEEQEDDGSRFAKDFFWCIDPLDGTLPFINKYPGYSVAISLISKSGIPQIGVIYDPSQDNLYHALKGEGAFKNGVPLQVKCKNTVLSYVTDSSLEQTQNKESITEFLSDKCNELRLEGIKEISGAGAVLNAIIVIENGPACMLKLPKKTQGGGCIWDYAASCCIYNELGLSATNYSGGSLNLNNKKETYMNSDGVLFTNF